MSINYKYDADALVLLNSLGIETVDVFAYCVVPGNHYIKHIIPFNTQVTTEPTLLSVCSLSSGIEMHREFELPAYGTVVNAYKQGIKQAECQLVDDLAKYIDS